jgi:hypothetical protein
MNMNQAQQRTENLQRAQEAVIKAEADQSIGPLKLAAALDAYAELLTERQETADQGASTRARACAIRAEYYKKELENDTTSDLELRAMLRQASKSSGSTAALTPETITSVDDFDQLIAARSSSLTNGKKESPSRSRTLIIVMVAMLIIATIGSFLFLAQHSVGRPH